MSPAARGSVPISAPGKPRSWRRSAPPRALSDPLPAGMNSPEKMLPHRYRPLTARTEATLALGRTAAFEHGKVAIGELIVRLAWHVPPQMLAGCLRGMQHQPDRPKPL